MPAAARDYLTSLAVLILCTAIMLPFRSTLALTEFAMMYLLGVIFVAMRTARPVAWIHSLLSVATFHFFFVPHINSFALADWSYLITVIAMHAVAHVVSTLTLRVRGQAAQSMERELAIQTEQARSALLSAASHDLKTPLASIYGAATTLLDQGQRLDDATRTELIEGIANESHRLNRLVSNLLEMTRVDAGVNIRKDWHSLEEIVGSALNLLRSGLQGRKVRVRIPEEFPLVYVDDVLLQQLFLNLIENALKYAPEDSSVEIDAAQAGGRVTISVRDHGPGFDPDSLERVFEKFFRGRNSGFSGVGLGLSICYGIAAAHRGRISAENAAGGGAIIRLELPLGGIPPQLAAEEVLE